MPDDKKEADMLFEKLSAWGKVLMPLEDAFWWAYFWAVTDKFGIPWMINYDHKNKTMM
jgi:PhnB protein